MKLTLAKRQPETHDVESFFWQPEAPFDFKPGQYLRWMIRDDHPDERGTAHFFTIASSPTEPLIRLTTKFAAEHSSTFKRDLKLMSEGETLEAFGPLGSFVLPDDPNQPITLVAGGIGVTPFRSMLRYLTDKGIAQPLHLIYVCRSDQDITYQQEFETILAAQPAFRLTYVLDAASLTVKSEVGRLDGGKILTLSPNTGQPYYLSGPEPMVKAFKEQLVAAGLSEEQIKTDYFPGYTA
jgi:ferredoxin-NADP reductase